MSTVRIGGIRFKICPQDHAPIHAHGRYAETIVIIELRVDGTVAIADRPDAIIPAGAKRSDVRKILEAAAECFEAIVDKWEAMHQ